MSELCRKHGISDATFYNWKAKFGGMTVNEHDSMTLAAARCIIAAWQLNYNTVRPHSGLGGLSPTAYVNRPNPGQPWTKPDLSAA